MSMRCGALPAADLRERRALACLEGLVGGESSLSLPPSKRAALCRSSSPDVPPRLTATAQLCSASTTISTLPSIKADHLAHIHHVFTSSMSRRERILYLRHTISEQKRPEIALADNAPFSFLEESYLTDAPCVEGWWVQSCVQLLNWLADSCHDH